MISSSSLSVKNARISWEKNLSYIAFPEQNAKTIFISIRSSLKSGVFDNEIVVKNGRNLVYRLKIIPAVFEDGGEGSIIFLENITERKSADHALRANEEQFRLMADNIQDGIAIYRSGKVIYTNRRIEKILDPTDELLNITLLDIAAPEERDRMEVAFNPCAPPEHTIRNYILAGQKRWIASFYLLSDYFYSP